MRNRVGLGEHFQQFLNTIENSSPEEIKLKLESVLSKLDEFHLERDRTNKELGEAENQINHL